MSKITINGLVFDTKKFAVDDGPGIRTTVFLKGCPMRCLWCHNPEGQTTVPELMYRHRKCIGCNECVGACPNQALFSYRRKLGINRKICSVCGACAEKCPSGALEIVGKKLSLEEVMKEICKDSAFYEESGGGITLSGGEPLMQIDFASAILGECRKRNIHTAVDTCGYASSKAIEKIKDRVDLFLYDLKIMDDEKHKKYTGKSNKQILRNFRILAENRNDVLVRLPLIPGINDDSENIQMVADFMLSYGATRICLLSYHRSGIEKYRSLNRRYNLKSIRTPSEQELKMIKDQFEASGIIAKIGG